MEQVAADTISCPRCRTAQPAQARFCGACGQALQGQAPPSPPPPPPPPPPPVNNRGLILGGNGAAAPIVVNADMETTYGVALRAVEATRGTMQWQGPPQSARFELVHRNGLVTGGFKIKYDGTLALTPMGPRQTQVALDVKLRSSSMVPIVVLSLICTFLLMAGSAGQPTMAMMLLCFGLGVTGYQVWLLSHGTRTELAQKILRGVSEGAFGAPAVNGTLRPVPPAPPVEPKAAPSPAPTTVTDQLRELGQLRQLGVLTDAEFEAKKAELLARL